MSLNRRPRMTMYFTDSSRSSMIEMASFSASSVSRSPVTSMVLVAGMAEESTEMVRRSISLRMASAALVWMSISVPMLPFLRTDTSTIGLEWMRLVGNSTSSLPTSCSWASPSLLIQWALTVGFFW